MAVKLITITPNAEQHIVRCARVSSDNPDNTDTKLLAYCVKHGHWSVFEQATATFEIETSVAIAAQMLRHKSFDPQMLSRRYSSKDLDYTPSVARKQAVKNRQSSAEECDERTQDWWHDAQVQAWYQSVELYDEALAKGISREQARFLLPQMTTTKLFWTGNIRSFIHWIELRTKPDTQQEHRVLAEACRDVLAVELPTLATALGWPT